MRRLIFLFVLVLPLAACQTAVPRDPSSPYYAVPEGSRLILHRALEVPVGDASVRFQSGKVMGQDSVDIYYPNCRLQLRKPLEASARIEPDTFVIEKVRRNEIAGRVRELRLAAAGGVRVFGGIAVNGGGGDGGRIFYETEMFLSSERQPDVRKLICRQWQDPTTDPYHLTINQIRRTLEPIFTLELAGEAGAH